MRRSKRFETAHRRRGVQSRRQICVVEIVVTRPAAVLQQHVDLSCAKGPHEKERKKKKKKKISSNGRWQEARGPTSPLRNSASRRKMTGALAMTLMSKATTLTTTKTASTEERVRGECVGVCVCVLNRTAECEVDLAATHDAGRVACVLARLGCVGPREAQRRLFVVEQLVRCRAIKRGAQVKARLGHSIESKEKKKKKKRETSQC